MNTRKSIRSMMQYRRTVLWIVSLVTVVCVLMLTWSTCRIGFETNDDTGIMMIVSGARTGKPYAGTIFCNILWGQLVSSLYTWYEGICWYSYIYIVLVVISLMVVCFASIHLFLQGDARGQLNQYACGMLLFLVFFYTSLCYYSVLFQFTDIAALCGMAAIICMLCIPKPTFYSFFLFGLLFIFSCTIRPKVGYIALFTLIYICIWRRIVNKETNRAYLIEALGIQCFVYAYNYLYEYYNGWIEFRNYHIQRATWTDYPILQYIERPMLYESVGWSENLFNLAKSWFFMDRNINVDTFAALNSANKLYYEENYIDRIRQAWQLVNSVTEMRSELIFIALLLIVVYVAIIGQNKWAVLVQLICDLLCYVLICFYFALLGRYPYRVAWAIFVVFLIPNIYSISKDTMTIRNEYFLKRIKQCGIIVALITIVVSSFSENGLFKITYNIANDPIRFELMETKNRVESYATENQKYGNVYIYDFSLATVGNPFATYDNAKPYNLIFWGGSGMYSPMYYDQLKRNGYEELYSDSFLDDNIFFLGKNEPDELLTEYMNEMFGEDIRVSVVRKCEGFIVYRYDRD